MSTSQETTSSLSVPEPVVVPDPSPPSPSVKDESCERVVGEPDPDEADIIKLASDGDLVLVFGEEEKKVLVSSACMKMASEEFAEYLSRETGGAGKLQAAAAGKPPEVILHTERLQDFLPLLQVVHFRAQPRERPTVTQLCDTAVVARRYGFREAIRYASRLWVSEGIQSTPPTNGQELFRLAISAMLFEDTVGFREATKRLICNYSGSFSSLPPDRYNNPMGLEIAFALSERRSRITFNITKVFAHPEKVISLSGIRYRLRHDISVRDLDRRRKSKIEVHKEALSAAFNKLQGICLQCLFECRDTFDEGVCSHADGEFTIRTRGTESDSRLRALVGSRILGPPVFGDSSKSMRSPQEPSTPAEADTGEGQNGNMRKRKNGNMRKRKR